MLEYLDRKLQKFNQGDKDGDSKDIVIQSLGMREARSQRKTETIYERLYRLLFFYFTPPWMFRLSYDEVQGMTRKWKVGGKELLG
jgi:hypothetical protein